MSFLTSHDEKSRKVKILNELQQWKDEKRPRMDDETTYSPH